MKIFSKFILITGIAAATVSCDNFLDLQPTDAVTDRMMWSKPEYAELYVNSFYSFINYYSQYYTKGQCAYGITEALTDMMKYAPASANQNGVHYGFMSQFVYGMAGTTVSSCTFYLSNWDTGYGQIRRINEFLYSMKQYAEFSPEDMTRFEAEARFFRGLVYFELVKRHNQVIVYRENMLDYAKDTPLNTEEESWDIVEEDLTFAAQNLPPTWSGDDQGRVTSYAAWALLSRAMLYAERWGVAKTAAEEVAKGNFVLMSGTTAADYTKCFSTTAMNGNTESVFDYSYQHGMVDHDYDTYFSPVGDNEGTGAYGFGNPTQEIVEEYEYAGGGEVDWTPWHAEGGTTQEPPYAQLEPRFGATILYNGASWKGRTIEAYEGGADSWVPTGQQNPKGTTTGYYVRKLVDENHTDLVNIESTMPWVMIRYAEVLLNKAEAAYRLDDPATANQCLREIRARVGLPYNNLTGTDLWNAIRKERKLELAFEGQYFWDLRRWGVLVDELNGTTVHGFKVTKEGAETRYEYVDCDEQTRIYSDKIYQIPLPESELNNNKAVQQFPEWR